MSQDSKRRQELEQLDKAALIEGYLLLEKRVASLEGQMRTLKQALGIRVEKTPNNSSLPPSQAQKGNLKPAKKAKREPKKGHVGQSRERQSPDEGVEYRVSQCRECGCDLSGLPQYEVGRHQIIDLPPIRPVVR